MERNVNGSKKKNEKKKERKKERKCKLLEE